MLFFQVKCHVLVIHACFRFKRVLILYTRDACNSRISSSSERLLNFGSLVHQAVLSFCFNGFNIS